MNSNQFFRYDIISHKRKVFNNLNKASQDLLSRAFEHDNDKIEDDLIFDIYFEHCQTQRSLPFGSKERAEFETTIMNDAVDLHIKKNRHHLYNSRNELTFEDANFMDYIEILCDWVAAMGRHDLSVEQEVERIEGLMEKYNFPKDIRTVMIDTYYSIKK